MNKKLEDMIAESKLKEILHKNEAEKQKNAVVWVLAIIGAIAGIAAIAYAVFRFVTPDYLEDFEDDFDDDFDVEVNFYLFLCISTFLYMFLQRKLIYLK